MVEYIINVQTFYRRFKAIKLDILVYLVVLFSETLNRADCVVAVVLLVYQIGPERGTVNA